MKKEVKILAALVIAGALITLPACEPEVITPVNNEDPADSTWVSDSTNNGGGDTDSTNIGGGNNGGNTSDSTNVGGGNTGGGNASDSTNVGGGNTGGGNSSDSTSTGGGNTGGGNTGGNPTDSTGLF